MVPGGLLHKYWVAPVDPVTVYWFTLFTHTAPEPEMAPGLPGAALTSLVCGALLPHELIAITLTVLVENTAGKFTLAMVRLFKPLMVAPLVALHR